MIQAK